MVVVRGVNDTLILASYSDRLEKNSNSTRSLSSRARAIERAEFEYTNIRLEQAREPNELFILIYFFIILIIYK